MILMSAGLGAAAPAKAVSELMINTSGEGNEISRAIIAQRLFVATDQSCQRGSRLPPRDPEHAQGVVETRASPATGRMLNPAALWLSAFRKASTGRGAETALRSRAEPL